MYLALEWELIPATKYIFVLICLRMRETGEGGRERACVSVFDRARKREKKGDRRRYSDIQ